MTLSVRFLIMTKKIVTKTLEVDDLWGDLRTTIDLFKQMGINEVTIGYQGDSHNFLLVR